RLHSPRFAGACCGAFPGGLLAWWVAPPGRGCIAAACTASINNTGAGEARLIPAQLPAPTTTTSAGDGPGRWRAGPSAAAPAKVRGGGVGGRRPGFGDMDVAEKPPWTGSRRPGRGPPTPPPPRQPPAKAEGRAPRPVIMAPAGPAWAPAVCVWIRHGRPPAPILGLLLLLLRRPRRLHPLHRQMGGQPRARRLRGRRHAGPLVWHPHLRPARLGRP